MFYWQLEANARVILSKAGVDSPGLCASLLTAHAAGLDKLQYMLARQQIAPEKIILEQQRLVERRSRGEPLAYILGKKAFYESEFCVSNAVLTPRPETEQIVDLALSFCKSETLEFADLGTGSGCIAISLLLKKQAWAGVALEIDNQAIKICKKNNDLISGRLQLVRGDIFNLPFQPNSFDLIVSNPPYISENEKNEVMWETLAFEPAMALFSERNGLSHIEQVIRCASASLRQNGILILEHGAKQAPAVLNLLNEAGFEDCQNYKDLANLPRCCVARKA